MTDHELMQRLARDDVEALEELIDRYRTAAERYARSLLGDAALAEDAVQEAFARVYLARRQYQANFTFRTWLMTLVHNQCIDQLRRERRVPVPSQQLPESLSPSAESELLSKERRMLLWRALDDLEERDRQLLMDYALQEMGYQELAKRHGMSVSLVKSRLHRIRRRLRRVRAE